MTFVSIVSAPAGTRGAASRVGSGCLCPSPHTPPPSIHSAFVVLPFCAWITPPSGSIARGQLPEHSMASSATLRRLMKEHQSEQKQRQLQDEQQRASSSSSSSPTTPATLPRTQAARDENILSLRPKDSELKDLLHWTATIRGPPTGCYDGEPLCNEHIKCVDVR